MAPVHLRSFTPGSEVWREVFISPLLMSVVFACASVVVQVWHRGAVMLSMCDIALVTGG